MALGRNKRLGEKLNVGGRGPTSPFCNPPPPLVRTGPRAVYPQCMGVLGMPVLMKAIKLSASRAQMYAIGGGGV